MKYSYVPSFAFTEQGIAMLSGLLNQETNVKFENNDMKTNEIFALLKELLEHKKELEKPSNPIGFETGAKRF
ncbi:MAG: hypothetical protein FWF65_06140 [Bacteroidetes bacterium]|nr:hypothetical protein [Bacteroidota bacterium]